MVNNPPDGPYPQLLLCPQVGSAPSNINIRTTSRMVIIMHYDKQDVCQSIYIN